MSKDKHLIEYVQFVPEEIEEWLIAEGWQKTYDNFISGAVAWSSDPYKSGRQIWTHERADELILDYSEDGKHTVTLYPHRNSEDVFNCKLRMIRAMLKRWGY